MPNTDCILWDGPLGNHGYGRTYEPSSGWRTQDSREVLAHRAAWERDRGAIPEGMQVHHRCGERTCVNAGHMELLTVREHASLGQGSKLTQQRADEIRWLRERGWMGTDIAAAYGVSTQMVCNIFKGRCWA